MINRFRKIQLFSQQHSHSSVTEGGGRKTILDTLAESYCREKEKIWIFIFPIYSTIYMEVNHRDEKDPEAHHFLRNLLEKEGKELNTFRESKYQAPSGNGDARA